MNILFLMDPPEQINPAKDSTYMLMLGYQRLGHTLYYLPKNDLESTPQGLRFWVTPLVAHEDRGTPFTYLSPSWINEAQVDHIWIRTDPPFDQNYLMTTWLLDRGAPHIKVFNSPTGIRTVNEKVWATQFTAIIPPTLVTANSQSALDFLTLHTTIIAKPTDGFGGASIFKITKGDTNAKVICEVLTQSGHHPMILQAYIPAAEHGDKRILLLNGDPLGAVLRLHSKTDHRNNFFAGGTAEATTITSRDLEIISILKPHLQALGLFFVGIDIIGEYLIEVNVTSPTCIQEINALLGIRLEDVIVAAAL